MKSLYIRNSAAVTASPSGIRDRSNLNSLWCRRTGRNSLSCSTAKKIIIKQEYFTKNVCSDRSYVCRGCCFFSQKLFYIPPLPTGIQNVCSETQRSNMFSCETKRFFVWYWVASYRETKLTSKWLFLSWFILFFLLSPSTSAVSKGLT